MKVLIIGATGLLGSDLCHHLAGEIELVGWARKVEQKNSLLPGVFLEPVDITDRKAVIEGIRRHRPAVVILTAAASDVDACERDPETARAINAAAVETIGASCAETGSLLIAVGTDYVFDGAAGRPYREEDPVSPINAYGKSKLEGEKLALASCRNSVVVRVSGLFGEARANFVSGAIHGFRNGMPVRVVTDQVNSPSYTVDLAKGFLRLLELYKKEPNGVATGAIPRALHLANAGGASRLEVAEAVAAFLGTPESLIERTTWRELQRPAKRPANTVLDVSLFQRVTGFRPRGWEEALQDFIQVFTLD